MGLQPPGSRAVTHPLHPRSRTPKDRRAPSSLSQRGKPSNPSPHTFLPPTVQSHLPAARLDSAGRVMQNRKRSLLWSADNYPQHTVPYHTTRPKTLPADQRCEISYCEGKGPGYQRGTWRIGISMSWNWWKGGRERKGKGSDGAGMQGGREEKERTGWDSTYISTYVQPRERKVDGSYHI